MKQLIPLPVPFRSSYIMLFSLLLATSFPCPQVYPLILGGSLDQTSVSVLDLDSNANIIFGGSSTDQSLVNSGTTSFIGKLSFDGTYEWGKQFFCLTCADIVALKFNNPAVQTSTNSTTALAVFQKGAQAQIFALINPSTGNIIQSFYSAEVRAFSQDATAFSSSQEIYFGVQLPYFMLFSCQNANYNSRWSILNHNLTNSVQSVTLSPQENFLYISFINGSKSYLSKLDSSNGATIFCYQYSSNRPLSRLSVQVQGSNTFITSFLNKLMNLNVVQIQEGVLTWVYSDTSSGSLLQIELYSITPSTVYVLVQSLDNYQIKLGKISITLSFATLKYTILDPFSVSVVNKNMLKTAKILNETALYYGGSSNRVGTNYGEYGFSKQVGFLMPFETSYSCYVSYNSVQFNTQSSTVLILLTTVPSNSTVSFSFDSNPLTFDGQTSPTGFDLKTITTYKQSSYCQMLIIPSSIENQEYVTGTPSLQLDVPPFTISPQFSCFTFTYSAKMTSGLALNSQCFSFNKISLVFSVYQATDYCAGTYDITITGTLSNSQTSSTSFSVTIINACYSATLTANSLSPIYYGINGISSQKYEIAPCQASSPQCQILYSITENDGSPLTNPLISSFSSLTPSFTLNNLDPSLDVSTLHFKYVCQLVGNTIESVQVPFQVSVIDCNTSSILSLQTPIQYIGISTVSTIQIQLFSFDSPNCFQQSYSIQYSNQSSYDYKDIIKSSMLNLTFLQLSLSTPQTTSSKQFNIIGKIGLNQATSLLQINVDKCSNIPPTSPSYQNYTLQAPYVQTLSMEPFQSQATGCTFTYSSLTLKYLNGQDPSSTMISVTDLTTQLAIKLNLTSATQSFQQFQLILVKSGTTYISYFDILVINSCSTGNMFASQIGDMVYQLESNKSANVISSDFYFDVVGCPRTYSLISQSQTTLNINSLLRTIDSYQSFYPYSTDAAWTGTYVIQISGATQISSYVNSSLSASSTFSITVTNDCPSALTPLPIADVYCFMNQNCLLYIKAYQQSAPDCPVSLEMTMQNGTALNSSIFSYALEQEDSNQDLLYLRLQVFSLNKLESGSYPVNLIATSGSNQYSTYFFVTILNQQCYYSTLHPFNQNVTFSQSTVVQTFQFTDFSRNASGCPIKYSLFVYDGSDYANYTSTTLVDSLMHPYRFYVKILPDFSVPLGLYDLLLVGQLIGTDTSASAHISLNITENCDENVMTIANNIQELNYSYAVTDLPYIISLNYFRASIYGCLGGITVTNIDGTTYDHNLITQQYLNMTIYTNDSSYIGMHQYLIKSVPILNTGEPLNYTLNLNISGRCSVAVILPQTISTLSYIVNSSSLIYSFSAFQLNFAECVIKSSVLASSSGFDTSIFAYDNSSSTLTVQTNDNSNVGTYSLYINITVLGTTVINLQPFSVKILDQCKKANITSFPISNIQYDIIIGQLVVITSLNWTMNMDICGSMTYSWKALDGSSSPSSFLSFNTLITALNIKTSNTQYVGTYQIQLTGAISSYATASQNFSITLFNKCSYAQLSGNPISNVTYVVGNSALSTVLSAFTVNESLCTVSYSLTNANGTSVNANLMKFTSSSRSLTINSFDFTLEGTYNLSLKGIFTYGNAQDVVYFFLIVKDPCEALAITLPHLSSSYVYYTWNTYLALDVTFKTSSLLCGSFVYTFSQNSLNLDPLVFNYALNSTGYMIFSVLEQNNLTYVENYNICVSVYQGIYTSYVNKACFIIQIQNRCLTASLTPTLISSPQFYQIGDTKQIPVPNWTVNDSMCSITYEVSLSNSQSLPTFVSYSPQNIAIFSEDRNDVDTYEMLVIGSIEGGSSSQFSFILNVQDPCPYALIQPVTNSNQTYYTFANQISIPIQSFTSNVSDTICGPFQYSVFQNGMALDLSIFEFVPINNQLSLYSEEQAKAGEYKITVMGYQTSENAKNTSFYIKIIDSCLSASIQMITNNNSQNFTYYIWDLSLRIPIQFVSNISNCGQMYFSWTIKDQNQSSLATNESLIQILKLYNALNISIQSNRHSDTGNYSVEFNVFSGTYNQNAFTFTVYLELIDLTCYVQQFGYAPLQDPFYPLKSTKMNINIEQFTQVPAECNYSMTYDSKLSSLKKLPKCIIFDPLTLTYSILTSKSSDIGVYNIILIGTLNDKYQTETIMSWTLTITDEVLLIQAPEFSTILPVLNVNQGESIKYTLPLILKNNSTQVTTEVDLKNTQAFASYNTQMFTFSPTVLNPTEVYSVLIILENEMGDKNYYNLNLIVSNGTTETRTPDSSFAGQNNNTNQKYFDLLLNKSSEASSSSESSQNNIKSPLYKSESGGRESEAIGTPTMKVDFSGEVQIQFKEALNMTVKTLNSSHLQLNVKGAPSQNESVLGFTWTFKEFKNKIMRIQLNFKSPGEISQEGSDTLIVSVKDPNAFEMPNNWTYFPSNMTFNSTIPKQMDQNGMTKFLTASSKSIESSVNTVVIGNFVLNVFLYSLSMICQVFLSLSNLGNGECTTDRPLRSPLQHQLPSQCSKVQLLHCRNCNFQCHTNGEHFGFSIQVQPYKLLQLAIPRHGYLFTIKFPILINSSRFTSSNNIENIGTKFGVLILLMIAMMLALLLFGILKISQSKCIQRIYSMLAVRLFFAIPLTLLIECYMDFLLFALLNTQQVIKSVTYSLKIVVSTGGDRSNFGLVVFQLLLTSLFPFFNLYLLMRMFKDLDTSYYKSKFGALYLELNYRDRPSLLYFSVFTLRRAMFVSSLISMSQSGAAQVQTHIMFNLLSVMYILQVNPFEKALKNKLEIFNELTILIVSYNLLLLTDFLPDRSKQSLVGYIIIASTTINILINSLLIIVQSFKRLKERFLERIKICLNIKKKKVKKEYTHTEPSLKDVQFTKNKMNNSQIQTFDKDLSQVISQFNQSGVEELKLQDFDESDVVLKQKEKIILWQVDLKAEVRKEKIAEEEKKASPKRLRKHKNYSAFNAYIQNEMKRGLENQQ